MANVNRWVRGSKNAVAITVLSAVTVELGDLMFVDDADNLRNDGSSTANNYGYPFEHFRTSGASVDVNKKTVKSHFLGIAMDDKDGISDGVNQLITVATVGIFNFDLKPPKSVRLGYYFGASGTTSASNLLNQKVMKTDDSDYALGYFAETKAHALNADVVIRTAFGGLI